MLFQFGRLPNIGKRNIKIDTSQFNSKYFFDEYTNKLKLINNNIEHLKNNPKTKQLLNKIFNSKNSLDDSLKIANHFLYAFNGTEDRYDKQDVLDIVSYVNASVVQNSGNILVVKVNDAEAAQRLGCITTLCFSRPGHEGESYWNDYAGNGHVFMIYDFSKHITDALFLITAVPYKSGDLAIYASTNVTLQDLDIDDDYGYLESIGVNLQKLIKNYHKKKVKKPIEKKIISQPQKHYNPNQLSIPFQEPEYQQVAELRKLIRKSLIKEYYHSRINQ